MMHAIAITGPTASGKTSLSIMLAKAFNCEIICCDSMQVYKHMDIGTAKATMEERAEVPHFMLDFLDPRENYSAEDYRIGAIAAARDITQRGRIPLFVGGTGLYIDTVMRGSSLMSPPSDPILRQQLIDGIRAEEDKHALWARLKAIDPASAEKIHMNNVKRVARAIEIYELSGRTKSEFDRLAVGSDKDIDVKMITLDFHDRSNLYSRVDTRVDEMIVQGLLREVKELYECGLLKKGTTASAAIGYKEILSYLDGEVELSDAVELIKLSTRRYAKRQLTWFRHEQEAQRIYLDSEDGTMKSMAEIYAEAAECAGGFLDAFNGG